MRLTFVSPHLKFSALRPASASDASAQAFGSAANLAKVVGAITEYLQVDTSLEENLWKYGMAIANYDELSTYKSTTTQIQQT